MGDEFETAAGVGLTEDELDKMYSGRFLSAVDIGDRKIKTKILGVHAEEMRQTDGKMRKRVILTLSGLDKELSVNVTNKAILKEGLGGNPQKWVSRDIGLKTEPCSFGGKPARGVRVVILGSAFTAKGDSGLKPKKPAAPKPDHDFPEEEGDPGFEPDTGRDFEEAAE